MFKLSITQHAYMIACSIEGCCKESYAKGFCNTHYTRFRKYGDASIVLRRKNGSGYKSKSGHIYLFKPDHPNSSKNGKIPEHVVVMSEIIGRPLKEFEYIKHKDGNKSNNKPDNLVLLSSLDTCSIKGCDELIRCSGMCQSHYSKFLNYGDAEVCRRANNGDGHITNQGYRRIWRPDHPNSNSHGTILEHRFVMSNYLNRPLLDIENVHHKNGNRLDNRIENLELWSSKQPPRQRVADLIQWARDILNQYENEIAKLEASKS